MFEIFIMFLCLVILAIPILSVYLFYSWFTKANTRQKKIGFSIISIIIVLFFSFIYYGFKNNFGFGPEYEKIEIKQNIGGKLIANSRYTADIQSWIYDVEYKYFPLKGDTISFGNGEYIGMEWHKDEQIIKMNNWLALQTAGGHSIARLIFKYIENDSIKTYDFSNEFIQKDSLWRSRNIDFLVDYCCSESHVEDINGKNIIVKYKFRIGQPELDKYGERLIVYRFDDKSGNLHMKDVKP